MLGDKLKFSNSLTIMHHNIRGLRDKIDELICSQTSNNINSYICLSEHAAEQDLLTLNLKNYYLASTFSCTKYIGGGSCIFVRSPLQFNTFVVSNFGLEKIFEVCAVQDSIEICYIIIVSIYRSPSHPLEIFITFLYLLELILKTFTITKI